MLLGLMAAPAFADELGGSPASVRHQHEVARQNDFTFIRTAAQVHKFVEEDRLTTVESNADLVVNDVSFPYTRPVVKLFVERLAAQYHAATGEQLVVTSLTRPTSLQPRNASPLSVHPAGMAVDLRIPTDARERRWLEQTLVSLEEAGVLDATRERHPAHYHVAVFPVHYEQYVAPLIAKEALAAAAAAAGRALQAAAFAIPKVAPPETPSGSPHLFMILTAIAALLVVGTPAGLATRHALVMRR